MNTVIPRYEFRAFAQNFGLVEDKIRGFSRCEKYRESREIYILSAGNNENNAKIRDDKMDIKVLVQEEQGLEQWAPRMKGEFPMAAETIRDEVFPALGVHVPRLERMRYTLDQFEHELIRPHKELYAARVFKRRLGFTVNGCITEIADLLVNGAAIRTVGVESEDPEAVKHAKKVLGLEEYKNVNYLLAIKRIIGMEPLPA
jgi:exopolyphosphatase/guanosine-5'-triphosphate,3'-diphosphate pyrophosphatase